MSAENIDLVTGIWSRLLQTSPIAPDDNFFDLGGDSLLAVNMFLEIERATGRHFEITTIYDAPTIAELAALIEQEEHTPEFSPLVKLKDGVSATPFFIAHGIGGTVVEFATLGKLIRAIHPVYAIQARGIDGTQPPLETIEEMADYYVDAVRTMQPRGPYLLGGYSFGGLIALEMARRLKPENVGRLLMIDAFAHPQTWPAKSRALIRARKLASRLRAMSKEPLRNTVSSLAKKAHSLATRRNSADAKADRAAYINNWLGAVKPDLPLPLRQTRIAGDAALLSYWPHFYPGKITFLRAGTTGPVFPSDAGHVWRKLVQNFELHTLKGDHRGIIGEHAATTAEKVSACLSAPKQPLPEHAHAEASMHEALPIGA